jgi:DNA-binding CsgD family transcriptional regulator
MNIQVQLSERATGRFGLARAIPRHATPGAVEEHLQSLARAVAAESFAVIKVGGLSSRTSGPPSTVLSSADGDEADDLHAAVAMFEAEMTSHMDGSLLPLLFSQARAGRDDLKHLVTVSPTSRAIAARLDAAELIAFPVKLGALGNGIVLFIGRDLAVGGENVLHLHRQCYSVLKALLRLDLKKSAPRQNLNDRELECLQLAGEGLKSELIARHLTLSVHTVNAYLGSATAKLDSVNRIQAIAKAIRLGYLS